MGVTVMPVTKISSIGTVMPCIKLTLRELELIDQALTHGYFIGEPFTIKINDYLIRI